MASLFWRRNVFFFWILVQLYKIFNCLYTMHVQQFFR